MKVTICIGSACHLKGSREIIKEMQDLVASKGVKDKVDLNGAFCSGRKSHKLSKWKSSGWIKRCVLQRQLR